MLETLLINHCSPTLAGLKTANLINVAWNDRLSKEIALLLPRLISCGIRMKVLYQEKGRALLYVYREAFLRRDLTAPDMTRFLKPLGYNCESIPAALAHLQGRIGEGGEFPHEIGAFLGYPLHDVIGFIQNNGKNCSCSGCWKVYWDECSAKKRFAQFKRCKAAYQELFRHGIPVIELVRPA